MRSFINTLISALLVVAFNALGLQAQESITISGTITDAATGESLIGATISVPELRIGATTNVYGFYSLSLPKSKHTIVISFIGFDADTILFDPANSTTINAELSEASVKLNEAVITANRTSVSEIERNPGVVQMDIKELNAIPVMFGEKDIIKSIQLMPGISAGEGTSGFFVRGGNVDQNLILLDEAPVYNPSHLLGFFSVFNSDAIKDVTLYKSGVPSRFGGRSSSVMDVHMNEGNMKEYSVNGGIGLISARLTAEGPIKKDRGSFIVSGRSTYLHLFIPLFMPDSDFKIYFYDINAKLNYKITDRTRIFASGYYGRDVLGTGNFGLDWGNGTGTLRLNHIFNEKLFSNTSFIFSNYDYSFGVYRSGTEFSVSSGIMDLNLKQDLTYYLNSKNTLQFGASAIHHTYRPGSLVATGETELNNIILEDAYGIESAIYASNKQNIWKGLSADYGVRISMFNRVGQGTQYTYADDNSILDSVYFGTAENMKTYVGFEPRVSLNYQFTPEISIKASYDRMYQYNHLLSNSTSSTPTDVWVPSSHLIKPQFSDQYALGYSHTFLNGMFQASVEGYYKTLYNVVDYENGADILLNPHVESQLVFGDGRAYGAEFLFRKKKGKVTGWIAYTLSRTERRFDEIDSNNWFPARQDRTHDLSIVLNYRPTKRWSVSANWVYYTGNAVTFPSGAYSFEGSLIPLYTERNGYRMPDYHRLDLGLTLHGKEKKRFQSDWTLSVYNAYARENAYSISFQESETDPGTLDAVQLSLFSIVPTITWNFKFK
jgi:hypothetical protein